MSGSGKLTKSGGSDNVRCTTGAIEVLLITSRETGRWVIPKGWPWPGVPDPEAAAGEAWEEAGVRGKVITDQIGTFTYDKKLRDGVILTVNVIVYLLEVIEEEPTWPEMDERQRVWFSPAAAAQAVAEQELRALLHALDP